MPLLAWRSCLETGFPEMDTQHKAIVAVFNQIHFALMGSETSEEDLVQHLLDLVQAHFRWEDELMERIGFPGAARHKAGHTAKLAELDAHVLGFRAGLQSSLKEWIEGLHGWFLVQILEEDQPLADFVKTACHRDEPSP